MKNYVLIKLPNTINWYSEGKTITDLMSSSKPIITNHTLDSLLRVGFQKSHQDDYRKYEGPFGVIVDLLRHNGIRMDYWYDDSWYIKRLAKTNYYNGDKRRQTYGIGNMNLQQLLKC